MQWIELITLLAVIQLFCFGLLVGRARTRYGIKPPSVSGDAIFERYFRVHQNTAEVLIIFLPAIWIAAKYWGPYWTAGLGTVYLIGRVIYLVGYVQEPRRRRAGFALSMGPTLILVLLALIGACRAIVMVQP